MAEEAPPSGAPARLGLRSLVPPGVLEWASTEAVFWPVLLFLLALSVYWFSNVPFGEQFAPRQTAYVNHINQAYSFLHGKLELTDRFYITEPALYDGENTCIEGTPGCKYYLTHPPMPAIVLMPGVALFGPGINATLVSAVVGALSAPLVFAIARRLTANLKVQLWAAVLFLFGSIFWFTASNGGVWFFSHVVAMLFMLAAIYVTLAQRNPFLAGLFLGAAYLSRLPLLLSAPFFVAMFFDQWWEQEAAPGTPMWKRMNVVPLIQFGFGLGIFVSAGMLFNYLRFDSPFDGGHTHSPQVDQPQLSHVYSDGILNPSYIPRHIHVIFEVLPLVSRQGSYVWPSWFGMAIWATTPAFFYALFANIRPGRLRIAGAVLLAIPVAILVSQRIAGLWELGWADDRLPYGIHLLPIWAMVWVAIAGGIRDRDRLVIGCWAAIILIALLDFSFAATGWTQFGYRYAMDFYPFLFLLTIRGFGQKLAWHHVGLVGLGVAVNLWGVLWIYQFYPAQTNGWTWVSF